MTRGVVAVSGGFSAVSARAFPVPFSSVPVARTMTVRGSFPFSITITVAVAVIASSFAVTFPAFSVVFSFSVFAVPARAVLAGSTATGQFVSFTGQ